MESLEDVLRRLTQKSGSGDTALPDASHDLHDREEEGQFTPTCSVCGDVGWVIVEVPMGHPSFGKVIPCRCRQTMDDPTRLVRLQHYSNLGPLARFTFVTSRPRGRSTDPGEQELFHQAYEKALAFAEDPQGWLVLRGPSGCGKTQLAAAVANRAIEKGQLAFFVFVPDLLDHLRSTFTPSSEVSYDQLFEQVRSAPLLVLDDLGGHSSTPWAQEKLYQVINHRYASSLPTVFTLGISLEQLEERWRTRLEDSEIATVCSLGAIGPTKQLGQVGSLGPEMLHRMTFDSFDVRGNRANSRQRETIGVALQLAQEFAETPEGWLLLLGPSGCGKTHLSVAIANERLKLGQEVLYFQVADLLDYLRVTFNPNSPVTYDKLFDHVRTAPILILEDFGTHHATPWAREKLHQIIVHRYDARLPTIVTTSDVESTEGDRKDPIWSRLRDASVVATISIDAPDYRYQGRSRAASSS